ncbi:MAG: hypothetical protein R6V55_03535 [Desulfovermiculus sp.]
MEITILKRGKYVDEDMRTDPNFASLVKNGDIHYVSLAEPGLNVVSAVILGCGFDHRERNDFMRRVNHAKETGTLYPKANITLLPVPRASYGGMDDNIYHDGEYSQAEIVAQLLDAFKAQTEYIKSRAMYFDFRNMSVWEAYYLTAIYLAVREIGTKHVADKIFTWATRR